ncbi:zf-TFIIB domain-containing protein [Demequina sp. NBRC 110057]|uniref:TFIIB-type zinc ribbon-containing protein n=1 Tax=Demequina sp. NBRC 110057 TaxID=1570346 RepID=UPI000A026E02|nr:zf-TFIIB domain-containing protein [Demequina sp. NBRC 110057]
MKCPVDDATLVMSDRQGVEIDYCPQCRGVWLDRGELDKIIERSAQHEAPAAPQQRVADDRSRRYDDSYRGDSRYDERRYDNDRNAYGKRKKKESWLGDLLDFG